MMENDAVKHLDQLLENTQESFVGLSTRWDELQPKKEFNVKISEDFHLGFVFGKLEDEFVGWFYSQYGRSMSDQEYKEFWKKCRILVRHLHEKYDMFYFQE